MGYAPQHVWLTDKRTGSKFLGPRHYTELFDYLELAPSQRAVDADTVTEPAQSSAARATEPARTTTRKTKAEEATR